jgi:poly(hydroxyalkanoate) depolymerase family esterase
MDSALRRYEFSERLADILGESRRDLRFRVTLMVTGGLEAPGPRGRGAPLATPRYAASLLIGSMAAPQQSDTVEAIRCYSQLTPTVTAPDAAVPKVSLGLPREDVAGRLLPELPVLSEKLRFGDALAQLLELAQAVESRDAVLREIFGIWVSRGCPVAGLQFGTWVNGQRTILTQRFELPEAAHPPVWLDPERGGSADPGLFHTVFLPVRKLVQIGMLTAVPDGRRSLMLKNVGPKLAALANMTKLAHQPRFQRRWEQLLSTLDSVKTWSDQVDGEKSRLVEVRDFGANPGELGMHTYVPERLPPSAPLVVLLHGCTQSAASFDRGTGWSTLADRYGFALLVPQQSWKNNPLRCFNWFRPEHIARESGEALSIRQMIDRMLADHDLDRRRVFVTGLSSGGAMTAVMLATYPEVFAGGAILAGVPYRAANGVQDAFESIFQGRGRAPGEWGDLVRAASSHGGPWPKVSVWHGDADKSVKPTNAEEIVKQWANVHGLDPAHTIDMRVDGHSRRVWQDAEGEDIIESYTISGMAHGAAVDPGDEAHQCGAVAPFFNAAGISSSYRIASFWGLVGARHDIAVSEGATAHETPFPEDAGSSTHATAGRATGSEEATESGTADAGASRAQPSSGAGDRGVDVDRIIAQSFEVAGLLKGGRSGSSSAGKEGAGSLGIDVHNIIATSLEAAGLLKGGAAKSLRSRASGAAPFGIDVPGIIATALEAAGVLNLSRGGSAAAGDGRGGLAGSGWEGEGWELLLNDPRAFRGGPMLHGHAASGHAGGVGRKVQSVARKMSLGPRPELSYVRRISLSAAANPYTSASFRILVDGVPVDEVSAVGMDYAETEWTRRAGIDLGQFADRNVTLTLEVAATSNVRSEVCAQVWLDEVTVENAAEVEQV